ncbi:hypothetical protein EW146_g1127 [Bondarzewia mesenterica]|uniref:CigA protein n=1 Tax=Bondarzewia mesenterica TaxID=1095465 RepID=A0A4S4M4V9_9AGAM|nr:hypothetical protein EW146_g1127 [Bondarzewia mesenterica]
MILNHIFHFVCITRFSIIGGFSFLILLLLSVAVSCFGTALYLFTASPESQYRHHVHRGDMETRAHPSRILVDVGGPYDSKAYKLDADKRYLAYLPHSGFHNQRIAFENALVLARILNRTLLVPPVHLGSKTIHHLPFDSLQNFLMLSGKEGLMHCSSTQSDGLPPECLDFFESTRVSWNWLVDMTSIELDQPLLHPPNLDYPWFDLFLDNTLSNEIFALKDNGTYDFRYVDYDPSFAHAHPKYRIPIPISSLANITARLIHLGTLFGSSRLHLTDPLHIAIRKFIREQMTFSNPILLEAAREAVSALGNAYLGAHVRVGDGIFQELGQQHARTIWYNLVTRALGFNMKDAQIVEQRFGDPSMAFSEPPFLIPDAAAMRTPRPPHPPLPSSFKPCVPCHRPLHVEHELAPFNIPLFISTDASDPHLSTILSLFHRSFPCTFFLSDLSSYAHSNWTLPALSTLDSLVSAYDGVPLKSFLLPFLDAMIVSNAWDVVGTEGSTFSGFVQDILWRRYHGWEIVQRG